MKTFSGAFKLTGFDVAKLKVEQSNRLHSLLAGSEGIENLPVKEETLFNYMSAVDEYMETQKYDLRKTNVGTQQADKAVAQAWSEINLAVKLACKSKRDDKKIAGQKVKDLIDHHGYFVNKRKNSRYAIAGKFYESLVSLDKSVLELCGISEIVEDLAAAFELKKNADVELEKSNNGVLPGHSVEKRKALNDAFKNVIRELDAKIVLDGMSPQMEGFVSILNSFAAEEGYTAELD